jgi:hypothetical protein
VVLEKDGEEEMYGYCKGLRNIALKQGGMKHLNTTTQRKG